MNYTLYTFFQWWFYWWIQPQMTHYFQSGCAWWKVTLAMNQWELSMSKHKLSLYAIVCIRKVVIQSGKMKKEHGSSTVLAWSADKYGNSFDINWACWSNPSMWIWSISRLTTSSPPSFNLRRTHWRNTSRDSTHALTGQSRYNCTWRNQQLE